MSAVAVRIPVLVVHRRGGVGDYYTDHCAGSLSWLNPFCYMYLNRDLSRVTSGVIESGFPSPPPPVPIAQTTLVPTGGTDITGNPTFEVVPQTAAENQAANLADLRAFFSNVADANAPDCSAWYNRLFNGACGGNSPLLWAGLAAGVGALWLFGARRRH